MIAKATLDHYLALQENLLKTDVNSTTLNISQNHNVVQSAMEIKQLSVQLNVDSDSEEEIVHSSSDKTSSDSSNNNSRQHLSTQSLGSIQLSGKFEVDED